MNDGLVEELTPESPGEVGGVVALCTEEELLEAERCKLFRPGCPVSDALLVALDSEPPTGCFPLSFLPSG